MSSNSAPVAPEDAAVAAEIPLALGEFCARLSATVKRPELIGAFEHHERTGGRPSGTASELQARFDAFVNKPIV